MKKDTKKYFAEVLGTAILVFISCGTAAMTGDVVATALAFGLSLLAIVYMIGDISGAHVNPAVSLGLLIGKKISLKDFIWYVVSQFIGGIIGGCLLFLIIIKTTSTNIGTLAGNHYISVINGGVCTQIYLTALVEIILTFVFVLTIIGVVRKTENKLIAGIVIGFTLTLVHLVGIKLTGTSVNPARSFGIAIFGLGQTLQHVWVFIVAPLVGGAFAGYCGRCLFNEK